MSSTRKDFDGVIDALVGAGINATRQINRLSPGIRIISLTMHKDPDIQQARLNAGASEYLSKADASEILIATIREANMAKLGQVINKKIGIWIDHKEAILVSIEGDQTTVERIESNAESHYRPSGGRKAGSTSVAQSVSKEQKADERRKHQFHKFYQMVIKKTGNADNIFIFGPGEAKLELAKEIKKIKGQHDRIAAVEVSDRLTENQIVAKMRSFFLAPEARDLP